MNEERVYIAIDLKSFYASVECRERGLDPLTTNLVVADKERTDKTICLAVSPSLKAWGVPGRPRLFEVVEKVKEINFRRRMAINGNNFEASSCFDDELKNNKNLKLDYIIAKPRMAYYLEYSTRIYNVYLKYFSPDDIIVYSIDEVFVDATHYLKIHNKTPYELAMVVIQDVLKTTGITATAGIGPNLYLCKIAMDIKAKHIKADKDGVRIAELNEESYKKELWNHKPITDFWRVGNGYAKKLKKYGMYTMGDVARCSLGKKDDFLNEDFLFKLFGVNAELLIDHAWGIEPCKISDVKAYKPENKSLGSGQVLQEPCNYNQGKIIVKEMADSLGLDLVDKGLVANQLVLTVGYDRLNLEDPNISKFYTGEITTDVYGRSVPKHAHGTENIKEYTSSSVELMEAINRLYERIVNEKLLIRRLTISVNNVLDETMLNEVKTYEQLTLFENYDEKRKRENEKKQFLEKEKKMQKAMINIKKKFGKNAILKGMNLQEGATAKQRNQQIGGHNA